MAAAIPVSAADVRAIVNLPKEGKIEDVLGQHSPLALSYLARHTEKEYYAEATGTDPGETLAIAFKYAFAFILLQSSLEFLNLSTLGEGIIKTTGIDAQSTELLTFKEIQAYKQQLELRALNQVVDYLNLAGQNRYRELLTGSQTVRGTRACVISGDEEDDV